MTETKKPVEVPPNVRNLAMSIYNGQNPKQTLQSLVAVLRTPGVKEAFSNAGE